MTRVHTAVVYAIAKDKLPVREIEGRGFLAVL